MIAPSVTCAACGARHANTALCDDCASHAAVAIDRHGAHDCGCRSCNVHRRAMLALLDTDLSVFRLPEVQDARGLPSVTPAAPEGPESDQDGDDDRDLYLPHEEGYEPTAESLALFADIDLPTHAYVDDCACEHCNTHRAELDARADEALDALDGIAFTMTPDGRVIDTATGRDLTHLLDGADDAPCAEVA